MDAQMDAKLPVFSR